MTDKKNIVSPYEETGYRSYILINTIMEGVGGFLLGAGVGFIFWMICKMVGSFYLTANQLSYLFPWKMYSLAFGGIVSGIAIWKTSRRESYKWDKVNLRTTETEPQIIQIASKEGVPVETYQDTKKTYGLWLNNERGDSWEEAKLKLTVTKAMALKYYLYAVAIGRENNLTREHAINSYKITRESWEKFIDIGHKYKFLTSVNGSSSLTNNRSEEVLIFMSERIKV